MEAEQDKLVTTKILHQTKPTSRLSSAENVYQDGLSPVPSHAAYQPQVIPEESDRTEESINVVNISEYSHDPPQDGLNSSFVSVSEVCSSDIGVVQSVPIQPMLSYLDSQPALTPDFSTLSNEMSSMLNSSLLTAATPLSMTESMLGDPKYYGVCRICACEAIKAVPLFGSEGASLGLVGKIHRCLPIKVLVNDDLPQQICEECVLKLHACNDFIQLCILGSEKLKAMSSSWSKLHVQSGSCDVSGSEEGSGMVLQNSETILNQESRNSEGSAFAEKTHLDKSLLVPAINSGADKEIQNTILLERRPWSCNDCDYMATRQSSLTLHKQTKHCEEQEKKAISKSATAPLERTATRFLCKFCHKSFHSDIKWQKHVLSHTDLDQLDQASEPISQSCYLCDENIVSLGDLQNHLKTTHNAEEEMKYKCNKCDKSYRLSSSLDIHLATHSTETPYLCDVCGKGFKHGSNLRCHKRSHADSKLSHRHTCDQCPKSFPSKFHLSEHKNVHLNVTPYSCGVCEKKFHRRIQLRQHKLIHNMESSHECPLCGALFNRRGNMTQHMKRHLKERKFTCKICKDSFQTLSEVVQHRRQHTEQESGKPNDDDSICAVCQKDFSSVEGLKEHKKLSCSGLLKSEPRFQCEICDKILSNRRTLDYHIRSFHTQERPFTCQFCSESFFSREACTVHERLHTGEKPYTCAECQMSFRCSSNLAQHLTTHRDDRPWVCDICSKSFKRKGILLVHMRTHTGEKPFCCDICGRRFTQKNDMLKHQQTHTNSKQTYVCGDCSWPFSTRKELNKHRRTHHAHTGAQAAQAPRDRVPEVPSHPQHTLLIADGFSQIPITIIEDGSNVIVHQIDDIGEHAQVVEVDSDNQSHHIIQFADSLLQAEVPDTQVLGLQPSHNQAMIQFEGSASVPPGTSNKQNWQ